LSAPVQRADGTHQFEGLDVGADLARLRGGVEQLT
jgi:hypothetical protein